MHFKYSYIEYDIEYDIEYEFTKQHKTAAQEDQQLLRQQDLTQQLQNLAQQDQVPRPSYQPLEAPFKSNFTHLLSSS